MSNSSGSLKISERLNKKKFSYIIQNYDKLDIGKSHISAHKAKVDGEAQLTLFKCLYRRTDENGIVRTEYNQINNMGRYFTKLFACQGISRVVRHTIYRDYYYDLDFKCAHPTVLAYYCEANNIGCASLKNYIKKYSEYRQELMDMFGLSKDEAKTVAIKIINGKNIEIESLKFNDKVLKYDELPFPIQMLNTEMRLIIEAVMKLNPKLTDRITKQKNKNGSTYNIGGSVVNHIMCDYENKALMALYSFLKNNNIVVGPLCFDGLLIEKGDYDINAIVKDGMEYVKKHTDMDLLLEVKDMDEGLDISEDDLKDIEMLGVVKLLDHQQKYDSKWMKDIRSYEEMKELWEQIASFCISNSLNIIRNPKGDVAQMSNTMLIDKYRHMRCENSKYVSGDEHTKSNTTSFIKEWIDDPNKLTYDYMEFLPQPLVCDDKTYNTWTGFEIETYQHNKPLNTQSDNVKELLEHIRILLKGDESCYKYMINWIAQMIQEPGIKPGIAIVLYSSMQGSGKNCFIDIINKMLGDNLTFYCDDPANNLYGQFTKPRADKLLINIDEADSSNHLFNNKIKQIITAPVFTLELKGKDPISNYKCFSRLIYTTNVQNCLEIEQSDRRFVLFDCSHDLVGESSYFNNIYKIMNDKHTILELFMYFKNYQRDVNLLTERPQTYLSKTLKEGSTDVMLKWIAEFSHGLFLWTADIQDNPIKTIKRSELFTSFKDYIEANNFTYKVNKNQFTTRLSKYYSDDSEDKLDGFTDSTARYSVDINISKLHKATEKYML